MGSILEQARAIRAAMDAAGAVLDEEKAAECAALYRPWEVSEAYGVGELRRYGTALYRCLTAHQGQESWTPDAAPSLWVRVDAPAIEWPEWRQPRGAADAYSKGSKVSHVGKRWVSSADANTWVPGVYGWEEVI